jgi:uncharacterized membrane protein YcaP (DUF421 family)
VTTHPRFERVQGSPTRLVEGGHPDHAALRKELITEKELDAALRRLSIDRGLGGVECVVLEPEGTLTPYPKPSDLELKVDEILSLLKERR